MGKVTIYFYSIFFALLGLAALPFQTDAVASSGAKMHYDVNDGEQAVRNQAQAVIVSGITAMAEDIVRAAVAKQLATNTHCEEVANAYQCVPGSLSSLGELQQFTEFSHAMNARHGAFRATKMSDQDIKDGARQLAALLQTIADS